MSNHCCGCPTGSLCRRSSLPKYSRTAVRFTVTLISPGSSYSTSSPDSSSSSPAAGLPIAGAGTSMRAASPCATSPRKWRSRPIRCKCPRQNTLRKRPRDSTRGAPRRRRLDTREEARGGSSGAARELRGTWDNHQTTILDLVSPTSHELSRAGFPPPLTLSCCGTYLQGGNGVDVQGDSTGVYPAHCRDQRTRVTRGKWHGHTPPGLPSCRTWSAPSQDGAQWSAHVEVPTGEHFSVTYLGKSVAS